MLKKLFFFYKVPLLISLVLTIVLIAINPSNSVLYFVQIFLGAFLGTFFLDIEFFFYAYIFEPDLDFSKTLMGFTKHGDLINALLYINYHKDEVKEKSINGGVFQIVMALVCISIIFATTYVLIKVLVLSIFANSIYRFAEYYYKGKVDEWFWAFKKTPGKQMLFFYAAALVGILVLCLFFFQVINLYGILISASILACILVVRNLRPSDRDFVWELAPWAILSGLVGARLYHIISSPGYYITNPLSVFYIWNGGLGIWGAVAGGIAGTIIFLKKSGKSVWPWLDVCAVAVPLGQAIGRWGNYFNQEIYGSQTTLPWGIYINGKKHHPLFLYESLLNFINFVVLCLLFKKTGLKTKEGFVTFLYLLNYAVIRFFMELMRQDSWNLGGLNVSLLIPILLFMTALFCLLKMNRGKV